MRDMPRYLIRFLIPVFVVMGTAIFVHAAGGDGSWWTVQTSGIDTNLRGVSAAVFTNSHYDPTPVVWASGSNGVILQSVDAGKNWKRISVAGGEALDFRSVQAIDAQKAYAMSSGEGDKSRIYKTTDGGANWKQLPSDHMPAALPNEGAFAASGTCLAVFNYRDIYFVTGGPAARVFHSGDAGYSWAVNSTPITSGNASSGIFSISAWDKDLVIVGGDYKDPNNRNRVAAYSADQGKTWKLAELQPGGFRSAVTRIDEKSLVAVGPNGEDTSDDGGAHWKHTDSLNLNALAVLRYDYAWAVGPNGTIARLKSSPIYMLH